MTTNAKYAQTGQKNKMEIEKIKGRHPYFYLRFTDIKKNHCDVCGKRRKTTGHHLIPQRIKSENWKLSNLKIRACKKCNKELHPENLKIEGIKIIERQNRRINSLENAKKTTFKAFTNWIDIRTEKLEKDVKKLPEQIENKRKIHPAQKLMEGRIRELKTCKHKFNYFKHKK